MALRSLRRRKSRPTRGPPRPKAFKMNDTKSLEMTKTKKDALISEREFLPVLEGAAEDFFRFIATMKDQPMEAWGKRHFSLLGDKAHHMESFLDDYHARKNRTFRFFTELIASIKWFGYLGFLQQHILIRFPQYPLDVPESVREAFLAEAGKTLAWLHRCICRLLDRLTREAKRIGLALPSGPGEPMPGEDTLEIRGLPHDIDEEETVDERHIIADVATLYKNLADELKKMRLPRDASDMDSVRNQTIHEFDETKCRHYESLIHNIQSKYDTYIQKTATETSHPELPLIRGHASIALHLFQMATMLVHFYERHENDIRTDRSGDHVGVVVAKEEVLRVLHGYVRYYGRKFFLDGEKHADRVVEHFLRIETMKITPRKEFTIHARPLSLIAKVALHYNVPLEMEIDGHSCNASSITQMILLAGDNPHPRTIVFRGEERALRDVKELFERGFFKESDEIPPHLNYLFV